MNTQTQATTTLPELINDIKRAKGGYLVYDGNTRHWTFFPDCDLTPEQVEELEDWREELKPRKAA